jgi:class 3 adenylate cyclase
MDRTPDLVQRFLTWLYRRLGRFYPFAFLTVELQTAWVIALGAFGIQSLYYDFSAREFGLIIAATFPLIALTLAIVLTRSYRFLRPLKDWIAGQRDQESSARAWEVAVGLPASLLRRDALAPLIVIGPGTIATILIVDLHWLAFFPLFAGGMVAVGYAAILHALALETGMRPVLVDINRELPPRLSADVGAIPLRYKLLGALPMISVITGLVASALSGGDAQGGGVALGIDVLVAIGVAATISLELTILLSKSILRPIEDLGRGMEAVQRGDYSQAIAVTTADELGELTAGYNQMIKGLAERERIREAFGTYLDKEVAEYILSEGFSPEGEELEVSMLFCDVRDFTGFAADADAPEVVSRLNALFETVVPIVARHGGHVDKFIGDGLLAVFGAPEPFPDHADRAVRCAVEMAQRVNRADGELLPIGIGVNTGEVVAGSIGGAGRLNFSVIGDPVNVAARVESATRELGDDVLITADTQSRLSETIEVTPRGTHRVKGRDEPIELFAPPVPVAAREPASEPA